MFKICLKGVDQRLFEEIEEGDDAEEDNVDGDDDIHDNNNALKGYAIPFCFCNVGDSNYICDSCPKFCKGIEINRNEGGFISHGLTKRIGE
jgi:hypothetical protein